MQKKASKHWFRKALLISILLHVLLFFGIVLFYGFFEVIGLVALKTTPASQRPLVFEFENPQVVETPESARTNTPADKAKFLSDKNAQAQNPISPENLPIREVYANGLSSIPEPAERPGNPSPPQPSQPERKELGNEVVKPSVSPRQFSRDFLTSSAHAQNQQADADGEVYHVEYQNTASRAPNMGGLSINTYDWDFAPYMLRLKRKIERNIFPPPAFTFMGIINGQTILRFRITPAGKLESLEVLTFTGHKTLMTTSVKAVQFSAPFEPLPTNFPEKYLEVTGQFDYISNR